MKFANPEIENVVVRFTDKGNLLKGHLKIVNESNNERLEEAMSYHVRI